MLERSIISSIFQLNKTISTPLKEKLCKLEEIGKTKFNVLSFSIGLIDKEGYEFFLTKDTENLERLSEEIGEEFVISEDLLNDSRFEDLELTYKKVKINFFAKCPFYDRHHHQIGSIIILNTTPPYSYLNDFMKNLSQTVSFLQTELNSIRISQAQIDMLENLSTNEEHSLVDVLTHLWNPAGFKKILTAQLDTKEFFGLAFIEIDAFNQLSNIPRELIVKAASQKFLSNIRSEDTIAYDENGTFQLLIHTTDPEKVSIVVQRIRFFLSKVNIDGMEQELNITIGYGCISHQHSISADSILIEATKWLCHAKEAVDRNHMDFIS